MINSIVIAVFLCLMVGMILYRTVSRDVSSARFLASYILTNRPDITLQCYRPERRFRPSPCATEPNVTSDGQEDVQEDWGWKLVHGEVFRRPRNPMILSVLVGNGAQLCAMVGITLGMCLCRCEAGGPNALQSLLCWASCRRPIVVPLQPS